MRNNQLHIGCLIFFVMVFWASFTCPVSAFEIPQEYLKNIDEPADNIPVIINRLRSTAKNLEEADEQEAAQRETMQMAAAAAYAEAFTTRTNLQKQAKENAAKGEASNSHKTEVDIISEEVQGHMRSSAERLNSIVALEAVLANMEGTIIISSLPKDEVEEEDKEDKEDAPAEETPAAAEGGEK